MPTIGAKFLCWWVALVWVCDLVEYTIELKSTNLKATFDMEIGAFLKTATSLFGPTTVEPLFNVNTLGHKNLF